MDFLDDFKARRLFFQCTDEDALGRALAGGQVPAYIGFDPTAASLHIGSLLPVMNLVRFARAGHRPIALVGGATGLVGDPSGKSAERNLLTREVLAAHIAGLRAQLGRYLDFSDPERGALLVNNDDWFRDYNVLDFLRDVGKHFSVNEMLHRESVKTRLHEREQGISYTEFSYMLLQGYDFAALHERHGCTLQMGGSDQWGNIVSGVELTRKLRHATAYGLTTPLLTKADGTKYGKSEKGNVWLDPALTSPYEFYQFLFNTEDADVEKLLLQLSLVPLDEIAAVMAEHGPNPARRAPQRKLAEAVTRFVHGEEGLAVAQRITRAFFGDVSWSELSPDELNVAWRTQTPAPEMVGDALGGPVGELTAALVTVGLFTSKSDARRGIEGGGVSINGVKVGRQDVKRTLGGLDVLAGGYMVLSKGAKNHKVVRVA